MLIQAGEVVVGTQIAEDDGFLFEVAEIIKKTSETITLRLCSDFSSMEAHWTFKRDGTPGGVIKTFDKNALLHCV